MLQVLVSVSASWAVLCTGLVRGWSSPALPLLSVPNNQSIYLETTDVAWMGMQNISLICFTNFVYLLAMSGWPDDDDGDE